MPNKRNGFTLVELSIVIVIIGLIISGVTAGQSLVKATRLKAIATNKDMYTSARRAFEMQYGGMAGDINNAQSYWSSAYANGDGSRTISGPEGSYSWQHLKLAGLINNYNYTGIPFGASRTAGISGYADNVRFHMFTIGEATNYWSYFNKQAYGRSNITVFALGKPDTTASGLTYSDAALTPNDAFGIDQKIDDGKPNMGAVMSDNGNNTGVTTCTDASQANATSITTAGTAISYLGNDTVGCRMMFIYK